MKPTVLLFDIDGTLISTGGAGQRAIVRALAACGVEERASFSLAGMTDRAIVRKYVRATGAPCSEERIDEILERYVAILHEEVGGAGRDRYHVHDGVLEALATAEALDRVAIGLGTGNIERGARIKLSHVGIWERFAFGGFGCDSEDRPGLLMAGAERGARKLGLARKDCRVVVIGDTPRDIAAAKAIGADSIAVATGRHGLEELNEHRPTCAVSSLAAQDAFRALLSSPGTPRTPGAD